ncbi:unnamed protein product [Prorocentrum cordatum]|uniref:Subtilisin n=1 Tax=Prorocentrum cordatum TaxID=2364126 RepID=A0ABN9WNN0_9DINO|nr:unnamed protein product [Polarella glacialis]
MGSSSSQAFIRAARLFRACRPAIPLTVGLLLLFPRSCSPRAESLPLGKIIATHHSQASRGSRVSAIQAALGGLRGRASKVLLPRPGLARGAPGDAALGARP